MLRRNIDLLSDLGSIEAAAPICLTFRQIPEFFLSQTAARFSHFSLTGKLLCDRFQSKNISDSSLIERENSDCKMC
jgi:hypothetical protein